MQGFSQKGWSEVVWKEGDAEECCKSCRVIDVLQACFYMLWGQMLEDITTYV